MCTIRGFEFRTEQCKLYDRPRCVLCCVEFQILNQTKYKVKAKRSLIRIAYTVITAKISSGAATDVHAVVHGKHTQYIIYIKYCIMEYCMQVRLWSKSFRRLPPDKNIGRVFPDPCYILIIILLRRHQWRWRRASFNNILIFYCTKINHLEIWVSHNK